MSAVGGVLRLDAGYSEYEPGPRERPAVIKPLIVMVGADKGGVGKTTIARVVDDYLHMKKSSKRVFDSEWPAGDLRRFTDAAVVDVEKAEDQMRVFDTVEGVTLLDIRAGMMTPTLTALDRVGLLEDVRADRIALALLHVIGPTVSSFEEIAAAAKIVGGGTRHLLVKNYVNETGFFEWDADGRFVELFKRMEPLTIVVPHLPARAAEEVQKLGGSFDGFASGAGSRWLRGEVRNWLGLAWKEFDRVGLGTMVDAATKGE